MDFIKVKDSDKVPKQFKTAKLINKLKVIEAAEKLGVSQPTLSAWEGERKSPGLDNLENMADLYGVTADFLLGRTESRMGTPYRLRMRESCSSPRLHSRKQSRPGNRRCPGLRSGNGKKYGWNRFLQTRIYEKNYRDGTVSRTVLSRMSMEAGFIWILTAPNGWHLLLRLKHKRIRRPASIVYKALDFDYSCFLNGLPNIQFLCSEHHKEKNISIFFLYASLHFQLYPFILKISPPPLCYMLYIEKPQNQESASSANSLALRLSGLLLNHGYLKLFHIY